MPPQLTFTLGELARIIGDPRLGEKRLRQIVTALGWKPDGHRHTGKRGHPTPTFDATRLMRLYAALAPFIEKDVA